jgi:hypothetical protein
MRQLGDSNFSVSFGEAGATQKPCGTGVPHGIICKHDEA